MRFRFALIAFAGLISAPCVSAESLYLTASERLEESGSASTYTFIAPYFTSAKTTLWISITKNVASNSTNSSASEPKQSPPTAPNILHAKWKPGQITYSVSCDLSNVLHLPDSITVSGTSAGYVGQQDVISITPDTIVVKASTNPGQFQAPATITDAACPAPKAATETSKNASFTLNAGVSAIPTSRAYLYLRKNTFFSDNANLTLDSSGFLSGSDTSSQQQVTAILTELAQAAGGALEGGAGAFAQTVELPISLDPRQKCFNAIASLLQYGPYHNHMTPRDAELRTDLLWTIKTIDDVRLEFEILPLVPPPRQARLGNRWWVNAAEEGSETFDWHEGLIAFFPVPARGAVACKIKGEKELVYLTDPIALNLYTESQFLDPQRDFFTNPQDTLTFNGGFITGHKYIGQSPAKTVVDTITAPIRALLPSVSVQQTTQVQTGGGKPDQTTTSTATTTSAPKTQ